MDKLTYHLIIGSNLGDRLSQLDGARNLLSDLAGPIKTTSQIYETQPWGYDDQPWFLNQAIALHTLLEPLDLIEILKQVETELGRQTAEKWHARTIDIDILFCGMRVFHDPQLILPHPHLQDRNFVLVPLMEIAPKLMHPILGKTIEELYLDCRDIGEVYIFNADDPGDPV